MILRVGAERSHKFLAKSADRSLRVDTRFAVAIEALEPFLQPWDALGMVLFWRVWLHGWGGSMANKKNPLRAGGVCADPFLLRATHPQARRAGGGGGAEEDVSANHDVRLGSVCSRCKHCFSSIP